MLRWAKPAWSRTLPIWSTHKEMDMELGFIGLGKMGSGIAANLVAAGHQVTVRNRDRTNAEPFAERGATVAADLAAAAHAGTVMTMLADDVAVEAVVLGDGGLLAAGSDLLPVSCSSVSVDLTGRLAAAHAVARQQFVSAQVLGRPDVAAATSTRWSMHSWRADGEPSPRRCRARASGLVERRVQPRVAIRERPERNRGG
jgi:nucleoside-diphosphate-sugar epimerase